MNIFTRKHKPAPQPIINDPHDQATVAMPVPPTTTLSAVKTVAPDLLQMCASCGVVGASRPLPRPVGYYGYLDGLPYIRICETCEKKCQDRIKEHYDKLHRLYVARKDTVLKTPAVKPLASGGVIQPGGIAIVGGDNGTELFSFPQSAKISATVKQPLENGVKVKILLDGKVIGESA